MHTLALTLLLAAPERPTVAVLPPVAIDGADSWLGVWVADNLAADLLGHTKVVKGKKQYPLNVFSWRETLGAARGEGLEVSKPLSPDSQRRLAAQLGARWLFSGSYKVKGDKVFLKWRLAATEDSKKAKEAKVVTNVATLSHKRDALTADVLRRLGEKAAKKGAGKKLPGDAVEAYARGLEILARQSLEPHAPVVLPSIELKKARLLFEEATRQAPAMWRAWVGLAVASAMLGDLERAEKEVLHALAHASELEPQHALGLYYLQVRQGKPEEAVKTLASASASHPGFMGALGYLGSAHLRAGKAKEAMATFRAYRDKVPKSPWARLMYARALGASGDTGEALALARAVHAEHPESLAVLAAVGARLAQAKKYDEAIELLEQGLARHGEHPALLTRLSYVHLQKGAQKEGLQLAQRAVEKVGDGRGETTAGYAFANLGHALALSGKKAEALTAFAKAAQLGIGVEERLLLLADERTKAVLAESPLAADAPPPAAAPTSEEPVLEEDPEQGAPDEEPDQEEWDEDEEWSEDWEEEDFDDEEEAAGEPGAEPAAAVK